MNLSLHACTHAYKVMVFWVKELGVWLIIQLLRRQCSVMYIVLLITFDMVTRFRVQ